ncbi:hypothetical protein FOZ62_011512, partial [Perkinsus olseni]
FYSSRPAALVKFVKNHAVVEWCYNLLRDKAHLPTLRSTALKIADILLSRLPSRSTLVGLLDLYFDLADAPLLDSVASTVLPRYIRWAPSRLVEKLDGMQLSPSCVLRMLAQRPTDASLLKTAVASIKTLSTASSGIGSELEAALLSLSGCNRPQAINFARAASRCTGLTWKSRIAIASILLRGNKRALLSLPTEALDVMSRLPEVEDLPTWPDDAPEEVVTDAETLMRMAMCSA